MSQNRPKPEIWFAEEWAAGLASVLESLSAERPTIASQAAGANLDSIASEIAGRHGAILWRNQPLSLPGDPVIWIGTPQTAWSQLAARLSPAPVDQDSSEARSTYLDVLRQSFAELAHRAAKRWNREVACSEGTEQCEPPAGLELHIIEMAFTDAALPPLLFGITGALENPESYGKPSSQSKTFDLLMGVELPVSVSFGHVQLPLKDILKLTAGSIVELNRMVDEPVEVIVNNCVVARGEVVTVEGNYGVRIHQILSRQQRMESLP